MSVHSYLQRSNILFSRYVLCFELADLKMCRTRPHMSSISVLGLHTQDDCYTDHCLVILQMVTVDKN
jgi:hypothetical protein